MTINPDITTEVLDIIYTQYGNCLHLDNKENLVFDRPMENQQPTPETLTSLDFIKEFGFNEFRRTYYDILYNTDTTLYNKTVAILNHNIGIV